MRLIDGERALLFGPFPGLDPRLLKHGSYFDAAKSLRISSMPSMVAMGSRNMPLLAFLVRQLTSTYGQKIHTLGQFAPRAVDARWKLIAAGQRAQIVKNGALQFGTEVIVNDTRTIAGVLGASPGASTAVPIMIELLERTFPHYWQKWKPTLTQLIPTLGYSLHAEPVLAKRILDSTSTVLALHY